MRGVGGAAGSTARACGGLPQRRRDTRVGPLEQLTERGERGVRGEEQPCSSRASVVHLRNQRVWCRPRCSELAGYDSKQSSQRAATGESCAPRTRGLTSASPALTVPSPRCQAWGNAKHVPGARGRAVGGGRRMSRVCEQGGAAPRGAAWCGLLFAPIAGLGSTGERRKDRAAGRRAVFSDLRAPDSVAAWGGHHHLQARAACRLITSHLSGTPPIGPQPPAVACLSAATAAAPPPALPAASYP